MLTDGDETDIVPEKKRRAAWGSSDSVRRLALRPQAEAQHRWQPVYRGTEARRSGSEGVRFLAFHESRLTITHCPLPITSYRLPITHHRLPHTTSGGNTDSDAIPGNGIVTIEQGFLE